MSYDKFEYDLADNGRVREFAWECPLARAAYADIVVSKNASPIGRKILNRMTNGNVNAFKAAGIPTFENMLQTEEIKNWMDDIVHHWLRRINPVFEFILEHPKVNRNLERQKITTRQLVSAFTPGWGFAPFNTPGKGFYKQHTKTEEVQYEAMEIVAELEFDLQALGLLENQFRGITEYNAELDVMLTYANIVRDHTFAMFFGTPALIPTTGAPPPVLFSYPGVHAGWVADNPNATPSRLSGTGLPQRPVDLYPAGGAFSQTMRFLTDYAEARSFGSYDPNQFILMMTKKMFHGLIEAETETKERARVEESIKWNRTKDVGEIDGVTIVLNEIMGGSPIAEPLTGVTLTPGAGGSLPAGQVKLAICRLNVDLGLEPPLLYTGNPGGGSTLEILFPDEAAVYEAKEPREQSSAPYAYVIYDTSQLASGIVTPIRVVWAKHIGPTGMADGWIGPGDIYVLDSLTPDASVAAVRGLLPPFEVAGNNGPVRASNIALLDIYNIEVGYVSGGLMSKTGLMMGGVNQVDRNFPWLTVWPAAQDYKVARQLLSGVHFVAPRSTSWNRSMILSGITAGN